MSLTAGATLQNSKYAVQKQLHQSDFGITYQAEQRALGRPVVMQTLNDALRQRHDFVQLRQQFLSRVQAIAQQPIGQLHVLDYFEEDGLPFVVFELLPGQPLPQFSDWIPVTAAIPTLAAHPEAAPDSAISLAIGRLASQIAQPSAPDAVSDAVTAPAAGAPTGSPDYDASALRSPERFPERFPERASALKLSYANAHAPRRTWMPMALIFLSMLGGLLGVGLGFSWRFSAKPAGAAHSSQTRSPNLAPRLFSREQSFPSGADWPISELPQLSNPDPLPVEAPYRSSAEEYSPLYPPLPAEPYSPAPLPPVQSTAPEPEPTISPSMSPPPPLEPILPRRPAALGNAPKPAPVEALPPPVEAAPEPLPPAAPEPPAASVDFPPPQPPKIFQN